MEQSRRQAVLALLVAAVLMAAFCLIWGLHYRGLDGGQPRRTAGNDDSATVALWTAGVVLAFAGLAAVLAWRRSARALVVAVAAVAVAVSGTAATAFVYDTAQTCACEGD